MGKDQDRDGFSLADGDCDDLVPTTNPQATDIADDGIDQNCDGIDGTDQDRDGYASEISGGNDCDDSDPNLNQNDEDEDGFSTCDGDCNDGDDSLYPIEIENELYCGVSSYEYSPTNVEFLSRQQTCSFGETLLFQNTGEVPLLIYSIDISSNDSSIWTTDDGIFSIELDEAYTQEITEETPLIIRAGEELHISTSFSPQAEVLYEGTIHIKSSLPNNPDIDISLSGSGVNHAQITEYFDQVLPSSVDILFAVDRSCSMADRINTLTEDISAFIEPLEQGGIDYHLSAVVDDDGCINGNNIYIDNSFDSTQAQSAIEDMIEIGSAYGTNTEMAFSLWEESLYQSITNNGCNYGFLRDQSDLMLIGFSDESEQSPSDWSYYISLFESVVDNNFIIGGIGGDNNNTCPVAEPYHGIIEATQATGGPFFPICDESAISDLAEFIIENITQKSVTLSKEPIEETIIVQNNGIPQDFVYDAQSNQVIVSIEGITDLEINYQFTDISDDDDGDGFSTCDGDCNDAIPWMYPGATLDANDDECMYDGDQDGFGSTTAASPYATGEDCDDESPNIYPQAPEICSNNIDENCDGMDILTCTIEDPIIQVPSSITQCSWYDFTIDSNENIAQSQWSLTEKPAESTLAIIEDPSSESMRLYVDTAGEYEVSLQISNVSLWSNTVSENFTANEFSGTLTTPIITSQELILDGGDAECVESGYSYSCDSCTVQFNAADLASIVHPTQEPMNIQWNSTHSQVSFSGNATTPDIEITAPAEEPGGCVTTSYSIDLQVNSCLHEQLRSINVDVTCCGVN